MTQNEMGTILVVDDDRLVLATLSHGLAQAGYDVIDADNGDDAILLAREHRPDLALLDIRMQGKSGFDVAAYLREYCRMPFMFLSAFSDDKTAAQVKALGAVAYLVKPLDIGQILPVVETAMLAARRDLARTQASGPVPTAFAETVVDVTLGEDPSVATTPDVLMAVGVLMHRFSLTRAAALQRLHRLAHDDGRPLAAQAQRVLDAVESLAGG
jgi:two-component system, response regulator PdtaR